MNTLASESHTEGLALDLFSLTPQFAAERLAAIVEHSDDAIISKDLNGVITTWNLGAERIFGYTAQEAIGSPILMLIPPGRVNEEPEILARIRQGQFVDHFETVRRHKDGTLLEISVTISPIRNSRGAIIGASKIARDISSQRKIQRDLERVSGELARAKEQLEDRVKERTAELQAAIVQMEEFSYTVSHDLRAPLRSMKMYSEVLQEELSSVLAEDAAAKHHLQRIASNCTRLDNLIQDLLTFGRVARDGITLGPVSIDRIVHDVMEHHPEFGQDNADVHLEPLGLVLGHEPSLIQVMSNLMINAVKFSLQGAKPYVRIYCQKQNGASRIWVEDHGIGVDPKFQHRLFTLFERLHPDLEFEGTGVGLAIVAKAMTRMGGAFGMESDGSTGSRFYIELPSAAEVPVG